MHSDIYTRLSSIGKKIPDQTEEMCYLHNDDSVWKLPIALHTHTYTLSLQYTQMIMMMTAMMLRLMILNLMTMATCGCIHE